MLYALYPLSMHKMLIGGIFMGRVAVVLLGILLIVVGGIWLFKDAYGQSVEGAAEDIAVSLVATKINESLKEGIYNEELDGPLLKVERDSEGNIKYIEPDTKLINKLVLGFSEGVKENYSLEDIQFCKVNLGVITGNKLLSQLPIMTKIKVQPLSLTKFQCETGFETQGINQTRYYVCCTVKSKVRILAPFTNKTAVIERNYQLAEAIIVGVVPDNYVMVPDENILDAME